MAVTSRRAPPRRLPLPLKQPPPACHAFVRDDDDLREFVELQGTLADSPKSWSIDVTDPDAAAADLSVKNPAGSDEERQREPIEILDEIAALDAEATGILAGIRGML